MPRLKLLTVARIAAADFAADQRSRYYLVESGHRDAVAGFAVFVSTRSKTYGVRTAVGSPTGSARFHRIGRVDLVPLADARQRARELLTRLHGGGAAVPTGRQSLAELRERYFADVVDAVDRGAGGHRLKPRTREEYDRLWQRYILPMLGERTSLSLITAARLWDLRREIAAHPTTANRVLQQIAAGLAHACRLGWLVDNPATGVERYTEAPSREAWTPDTYRRIGAALRHARSATALSPVMLAGLELVILHGARPSELISARRDWLDLEARVLRLPSAKGDRPGRRRLGRTLYLVDRGLEIIRRVLLPIPSPWLLPSPRNPQQPINRLSDAWRQVADLAGVSLTLRSSRAGWRTELERAGVPLPAIHRLGDWRGAGDRIAEGTYYRPTADHLAAAAEQGADHLRQLLDPDLSAN